MDKPHACRYIVVGNNNKKKNSLSGTASPNHIPLLTPSEQEEPRIAQYSLLAGLQYLTRYTCVVARMYSTYEVW